MPEFSHHYAWLGETLTLLENAEKGDNIDAALRSELESGRGTCRLVLEQNPASELGQRTLERIDAVLGVVLTGMKRTPFSLSAKEQLWEMTAQSMGLQVQDFLPSNENEQRLEERIEQFEEKFLSYGTNDLLPLTEQLSDQVPREQGLKRALSYPFDTIRNNAENPLRNVEVVRRVSQKFGVPWSSLLLFLRDPNHFAYGSVPDHAKGKITAGFAPMARMMAFTPDIDLSNEMDMLTVLHECLHVPQHAKQRQHLDWYLKFYGVQHPRVIANDEYQTYGLELEAMNMRLDGLLEQAAIGSAVVERDKLMESLSARPEQWMMVEMLRQLAEKYFPHGDAVSNNYPQQYCDMVQKICLHDGYEVFENRGNQLVKITL